MNLVNVLLDKQFKLTLLENNKTDNIIFCKPFEDTLHNLCSYTTRNEDFIYRYVLENGERFIITDILLENGTLYKKVKFKLVTINENQVPYSVINLKSLTSGEKIHIPVPAKPIIVKEQTVTPVVPEPVKLIAKKEVSRYDAQEDINKVKLLEQDLLKERIRLENEKKTLSKQKLLVDNQNTIQSTIESFKEELIQEFHNISQRQESLFQGEVLSNVTKIKEQNEKIQDTFDEAFRKMQVDTLYKLKETIKNNIQERKQELEALIESKSGDYIIKVVEKADELKSLFDEKLAVDLQQYKEKLIIELVNVSKKQTREFLDEGKAQTQKELKSHIKIEQDSLQKDFDKNVRDLNAILEKATQQIDSRIPFVEEKIKLVHEKINELNEGGNLLEEAKEDILLDSKKYTDTKVNQAAEEARNYARRILDLGGGGGSVAVQYADGGTMNGDLNVNGNYLSGGVNLLDIFALQPDLDNQTLSFNESNAQLSISNGNTVSLSALSGEYTDRLVSGSYQVVLSSNGAVTFPDNLIIDNSTISNLNFNDLGGGSSLSSGSQIEVGSAGTTITSGVTSTGSASILAAGGQVTLDSNKAVMEYGLINSLGGGSSLISQGRFAVDNDVVMEQVTTNSIDESSSLIGRNQVIVNSNVLIGRRVTTITDGNTVTNFSGWTFDNGYGTLTFPNSTTQTTAFTGIPDNIAYTNQDTVFEKNVTIQGNLTALGTSTFQNTIFTTTSALSVVSLGPGPALYVFQAAGPSDVASFYDGDGIEVLHVGNAQGGGNPLGQVGINTSYPSAELTVNGAISSNGFITVLDGNSDQWNSAYTSFNSNSGKYDSVYTTTNSNSGKWESNYTSFNTNSAKYDSVYTSFNSNSAKYDSVYTSYNAASARLTTLDYLSTNNVYLSSTYVTDAGYLTNINKTKTGGNVSLVGYNFFSLINSLASTVSPALCASTVRAGSMTRAAGIDGFASTVGWGSVAYTVGASLPTAVASGDYYTIPIYSTQNDIITINSISTFIMIRSPAGPKSIGFLYSTSSNINTATTYSTGLSALTIPNVNTDISGAINTDLRNSNITIYPGTTGFIFIVPYDATGAGGTLRFITNSAPEVANDLSFIGNVAPNNYKTLTVENNMTIGNNLTVNNNLQVTGNITGNKATFYGNVEIAQNFYNLILKSPNGNRWAIFVTDAGALSATQII